MEKVKNKKEIILETVEFYSNNPRSVVNIDNKIMCKYHGPNNSRCAFSRVVKEEIDLGNYEGDSASRILIHKGFNILKGEYRIEDSCFWDNLQVLHDNCKYWEGGKLSKKGQDYVNLLLLKYEV